MQSYNPIGLELSEEKQNSSQTSDSNTPISESVRELSNLTPFVRYATTGENERPEQLPRLHRLDEPAPPEADFISPVYFLTDRQAELHEEVLKRDDSGGWAIKDCSCIAEKLQNQCEEGNRVRYPVFVESDADVPFYQMREGLKRFIREVLEVDPAEGRWYFSGGSSLHVHLPYFVKNYIELQRLRREAKGFNEDAEVTVDASNYSRKSLIRLPGATHDNTGIEKLPVFPDTSDDELQKRIAQMKTDVLPHSKRKEISYTAGSAEIGRFSLSQELALIKDISTPLEEQCERPTGEADLELWKRYNRHPFSPYANTGNERRSIVVAQVKESPYCRADEADKDIDRGTFLPAFIYGAVGADGGFTVWRENGRIRLSDKDYEKWDYEQGDTVVIIGGQSNSSRIIKLGSLIERESVVGALLSDSKWVNDGLDGREEALEALRGWGYGVGSAGKNGPYRADIRSEGKSQPSRAHRLQKQAERDGIETLSHQERLDVGNRLLSVRGWDGADEWFQEQFGARYDREVTHTYLRSITKGYDDLPPPPV
jgi:hypothetical protein